MMKTLIGLCLLIAAAIAAQKRYDNYQVFRVTPKNQASLEALIRLHEETVHLDFWTEPNHVNRGVDVMVPPDFVQAFVQFLETFHMEYLIKVANVQSELEKSRRDIAPPLMSKARSSQAYRTATPRYSLNWSSYSDYPAVVEFVNEVATAYPNLVTVINIGKSYEGNDMLMVKISTGGTGKKAIFADACIHAREWIATSFATWLIHELVENYADHPQYVDNLDWYIVPVMNPDGYRWTFHPNGDRLWRKNRTPTDGLCIGTDLNRNFDYQWNTGGSSSVTCSEVYHGGAPFNQVESRNARDAILPIANQTKIYLALHSYGQYLLTPWGFTSDLPDDYPELLDLANKAMDKLKAVNGTVYTFGTSTNLLGMASGCSDDWAKGAAGISYSYVYEMRDTGTFGFQLPAEQIMPNNLEVWEAVKVMADFVATSN